MDCIRGIYFIQSIDCLASVSEDCSIKLWSVKGMESGEGDGNIEPYVTLRGHAGPIFAITGKNSIN